MPAQSSEKPVHRAWIEQARLQSDQADRQAAEARVAAEQAGAPVFAADHFPGYELEREIHRGAQGVVYRAVQKSTSRRVALKLLHDHAFGGSLERARFEREMRVLATVQHPNIVAIHDGGSHDGRFFLVMDYIAGQPLDVYMASQPRSIRETLDLFIAICDAVNAAHVRGIIHRDLKPANVRVDATGRPFVLDFGLAKFANVEAADRASPEASASTMALAPASHSAARTVRQAHGPVGERAEPPHSALTLTGQFLGSLPWSAPEQAEGSPTRIDLRTDVYSLGVLLYQMLTGKFPYPVSGPVKQVFESILHVAPTPPRSLRREIDDELETILLKCLSKEQERRYQIAGELAADLRRYVAGEPIAAKRDSTVYLLRKALQRHRRTVAAVAAFFLLLAGATVFSFWLWRDAASQRDEAVASGQREAVARQRATDEATKATQIAQFAQEMLSGIDPATAGAMDKRLMRLVLDGSANRVGSELGAQPEVQAAVQHTIGKAYQAIGELAASQAQLESALEIRRQVLGAEHAETLVAMDDLAMLYQEQAKLADAEHLCRTVMEARRRVLGVDHRQTLFSMSNLTEIWWAQGKYGEAETLIRAVLQHRERSLGPEHPETLTSINNLAGVLRDLQRFDEAERLFKKMIDIEKRVKGEHHPHTLRTRANLARLYQDGGRMDDAETLQRELLAVSQRVLGEEHPDTLSLLHNVAIALRAKGQLDEAEAMLRRVVEVERRVLGDKHPNLGSALLLLASIVSRKGDSVQAEPLVREAVAIFEASFPADHNRLLTARIGLGVCLSRIGKFEEAERLLLEGHAAIQGRPDVLAEWKEGTVINLVKLYEAWDVAEPNTGKIEKAAAWRVKLPSTLPAATTQEN